MSGKSGWVRVSKGPTSVRKQEICWQCQIWYGDMGAVGSFERIIKNRSRTSIIHTLHHTEWFKTFQNHMAMLPGTSWNSSRLPSWSPSDPISLESKMNKKNMATMCWKKSNMHLEGTRWWLHSDSRNPDSPGRLDKVGVGMFPHDPFWIDWELPPDRTTWQCRTYRRNTMPKSGAGHQTNGGLSSSGFLTPFGS